MGAAVCTPKEDNREQVEANASTERARESASADLEAEFQAFMDAYPETGRKRTSWAGARNAFAQAARQVPRPSVLTECVKAYAADPILLASKHGAVNAVEFLAGERWRSFMPKSAEPQALPATSAASGWDGPAEVWAAVCADKKLGEGWAASWLAPCVIEAGVLHPRTGIAADRLRQEVGGLLAHYGLQIGEARKPGSLGGADGH
jgi:hypothetical protein